jgi:hypothetical protein
MTMVIAEVSVGLCGIESYRYPHTVLRKAVAEGSRSPVRFGLG